MSETAHKKPILRPMNLGEILDRTFQIYRSRFLVFAAVAALPALATLAEYGAAWVWQTYHPVHGKSLLFGRTLPRLAWWFSMYAAYAFFWLLFRPALVRGAEGSMTGTPYSVRHLLMFPARRWKTMILLNMAEQLTVVFVPGLLFCASVATIGSQFETGRGNEASTLAASLILLLAGGVLAAAAFWWAVCLSLTFPAVEFEGIGWFAAIKRSLRLTRNSRGRILFTWLALLVGSSLAASVVRWTIYFALRPLLRSHPSWQGFPVDLLYSFLPSGILRCLVGPIYPIALTLFYYDQRIRLEGYDIEQMMETAGLNSIPRQVTEQAPAARVVARGSGD